MPPTEEAGLLNALNIPQPKEMAVYGLYGPAQAKQINYGKKTNAHLLLQVATRT